MGDKVGNVAIQEMDALLENHDFLFDYALHTPDKYNTLFAFVHKRRDREKYHFIVSGEGLNLINDWFDTLQELRDIQPFDLTRFYLIQRGGDITAYEAETGEAP